MSQQVLDAMIVLNVIASFGLVLVLGARRRDLMTPLISAVGAALALAGRYALDQPIVTAAGE